MPFLKGTPLEVHGGTLCLVGFVFHVEPQLDVAGDFGQHLLTLVLASCRECGDSNPTFAGALDPQNDHRRESCHINGPMGHFNLH